jgi:hypothetical protein
MGYFGLVQGNNHSQETNAEASEESTCHEVGDLICDGLEDTSNDEDDGTNGDGPSSAGVLGSRTGEHGAKESAGSK